MGSTTTIQRTANVNAVSDQHSIRSGQHVGILAQTDKPSPVTALLVQQIGQELLRVKSLMQDGLGITEAWPAGSASIYHLNTGGGYLRARLALWSGMAFDASLDHRLAAAAASELVHNASLVHDDICDADRQRRGQPSVWQRDNIAVALCSGDLLLTASFRVALKSDTPEHRLSLIQVLTDRVSQIIAGQSVEVAPPTDTGRVTLQRYLQVTLAKTAPLIMLPLEAGAMGGVLSSAQHAHIQRFANAVGLAYQIIDDLDDIDVNTFPPNGRFNFHAHHALSCHGFTSLRPSGASARHAVLRALQHAEAALARAEQIAGYVPKLLAVVLDDVIAGLQLRLTNHHQTLLLAERW